MIDETPDVPSIKVRAARFWSKHRSLLWGLHSVWALITGIVVIVLAHEQYGFIPWLAAFLAFTWASTMYFGRQTSKAAAEDIAADEDVRGENRVHSPGLVEEVSSYLTRIFYQETLFFLLPFYAYSAVIRSWNVVFLGLLAGLALFSCLDVAFDRWLRTKIVFAMVFFATVTFAALNMLLPMALHTNPALAVKLSALIAVAVSIPLALRGMSESRAARWRLVLAAILVLAIPLALPALVPPVPIRMISATFANDIGRSTLVLTDSLDTEVTAARLEGRMVVLVRVFAPITIPARVTIEWKRDGQSIRTSREVRVEAHDGGFRLWDGWAPTSGVVEPGDYSVVLRTAGRRVFGVARITVTE